LIPQKSSCFGDKVNKIQAVLSGSLNFILIISMKIHFHDIVKKLVYWIVEPDPKIDLSETTLKERDNLDSRKRLQNGN
jgi:homoserine dehydrogenase